MAAELKKELGIDAEVIRGSGGVFNVVVGNKVIFSKHEERRFPTEREIVDVIRAMKSR